MTDVACRRPGGTRICRDDRVLQIPNQAEYVIVVLPCSRVLSSGALRTGRTSWWAGAAEAVAIVTPRRIGAAADHRARRIGGRAGAVAAASMSTTRDYLRRSDRPASGRIRRRWRSGSFRVAAPAFPS